MPWNGRFTPHCKKWRHRHQTCIIRGHDETTDLGDIWTWNGYSRVTVHGRGPGQPPIRSDAMAAMDSSGSVVKFGGSSTGTGANDLWRLS